MLKHKILWLVLTIVFAVLMIVFFIVNPIVYSLGLNVSLNNYLPNIVTSKKTGNKNAPDYYTSAFDSQEDLEAREDEVCQQLEGEGAALLLNNNNALPLHAGTNHETDKGDAVSIFSISSYDFMYGGTGSGAVNTDDAEDLPNALYDTNFEVNGSLAAKYYQLTTKYKRKVAGATGGYSKDYYVNEAPVSELKSCESYYSLYGDAAIITLARSGGEGADLPRGTSKEEGSGDSSDLTNGDYLVLTQEEKDLLNYVKKYKDNGTFKKVILILNSSNAIQLDFLEEDENGDNAYGIDSVLWVGDVGQTGIMAVCDILAGNINPSGRIVDTFLNDNQSSPAMQNFGIYEYTNTTTLGLASAQNNQDGAKAADVPDSSTDADITKLNSRYVVEEEGIYVGYKYYETRYEDYVLGQGNASTDDNSWSYSDDVAYPFGSGISYLDSTGKDYTGSWDYSEYSLTENTDTIDISVKVTNGTGVAGKHTVQIYMQSPYTAYDIANKVEKASVQLVGFDKTDTLQPGDSQTLTISVNKSEMKAYDYTSAKTYIVDPGTYYFTIGRDAHDAINNIIAAKISTDNDLKDSSITDTEAVKGRMDADGDTSVVKAYKVTEDENNKATDSEGNSVNLTYQFASAAYGNSSSFEITNQFDNADVNNYTKATDSSSTNETVTYLSRSDWKGTWPTKNYSMAVTEQMWEDGLASSDSSVGPDGSTVGNTAREALVSAAKETFTKYYKDRYGVDTIEMPTTNAKTKLQLFADTVTATQDTDGNWTLTRTDIKSDKWNELLAQASYSDMTNIIYNGFRQTEAIDAIGLPSTIDFNGPQGFTNALTSGESGMAYTSEDVMAATYNRELVKEMGECMGEDFLAHDCPGIYGPGGNIHRTPYSGRNFEYYSEDGFLSGEIAAVECAAIQSKGVYVFMKHCVLNDMESGRYGLSTFANEQAIREIYLRPFEGAIVNNDMVGVMTSFNRIGVVWSGADFNLLTNVLREEFAMDGIAITDCTMFATPCDYRLGVLAGQNIWDGMSMGMATLDGLDSDATMVTAVREATKWIAYNISGSLAMNGIDANTKVVSVLPWWSQLIWALGGIFAAFFVAGAVLTILSYRKSILDKKAAKAGDNGTDTGSTDTAAKE